MICNLKRANQRDSSKPGGLGDLVFSFAEQEEAGLVGQMGMFIPNA